MNWEYIGVGLAVLAIGITLVIGVPPPWWPEMPKGLVRGIIACGVLVAIAGLYLLVMGCLSSALKERSPWPIAGMLAGALIFLGSAGVWFYGPHFKTLPGFSAFALARLYDTPELRRKYIFDFASPDGAKVSLYLASDDLFRFQLLDINKEAYTLDIPIGDKGVPIDRYVFIYCEVGLGSRETVLRVLIDGKEVRRRSYDFPIALGSRNWKQVTVFADNEGKNTTPFKIAMFGFGHATMSDVQIEGLQTRFDEYLRTIGSSIVRPS
jgi:hypothetical protein